MKEKLFFHFKLYLSAFLCLYVVSFESNAQSVKRQSIASYGSVNTIDNISFHQTIGQPYYTRADYGSGTSILPGFQQPVSFYLERIISDKTLGLNLKVYPNPATNSVIIQSQEVITNSLVKVIDTNGKLILTENINDLTTFTLNCETWKNGVYFINIFNNNLNISSIKLIINK